MLKKINTYNSGIYELGTPAISGLQVREQGLAVNKWQSSWTSLTIHSAFTAWVPQTLRGGRRLSLPLCANVWGPQAVASLMGSVSLLT